MLCVCVCVCVFTQRKMCVCVCVFTQSKILWHPFMRVDMTREILRYDAFECTHACSSIGSGGADQKKNVIAEKKNSLTPVQHQRHRGWGS
jgi:hypothetical protein